MSFQFSLLRGDRLPVSVLLAVLAVPLPAAFAQKADGSATASQGAPPVLKSGTGTCQELYESIRKTHDELPDDMRSVKKAKADALAVTVESAMDSAARFETDCFDGDRIQLAEVQFVHAKFLYLLSRRYLLATTKQLRKDGVRNASRALEDTMRSYYGNIQELARSAFETLPREHPFRPRALQYIGQAAADAKDFNAALDAYQRFTDLYPEDEKNPQVILAMARIHLDMRDYDLGVALAERVQKDYYDTSSYPIAVEILWKLYHARGDLDGMWRCVETVQTVYPLKLSNEGISPALRERLQMFLDFSGFRKGYTLMARAEFSAARKAFEDHIAYMQGRKDPNPAAGVVAQRSRDCLAFIEKLAGQQPPKELDLQWVTPDKLRLADARGKTVAVVFRGVGDTRSAKFLGPTWDYCNQTPGVQMVVVSYLRRGVNSDGQAERMRAELASVGYGGPAGFDPDGEKKTIFRSYGANVGSATLFIVNPAGKLVWFMQDPRGVDTDFARVLLARAAGQRLPEPAGSATGPAPGDGEAETEGSLASQLLVPALILVVLGASLLVVFLKRSGKPSAQP